MLSSTSQAPLKSAAVAPVISPSLSESAPLHANQPEPDVFISGGGPAGLACAIACALKGLSVEVADGMAPPIDKACGEGLMPDTIAALTTLGVDLSSAESVPFRGIRFLGIDRAGNPVSTQAIFSQPGTEPRTEPGPESEPGVRGLGMRRPLLHQLLLDRATELGVRFSWQTAVQAIQTQGIQRQGIRPGQGTARSIVRTNRHTVRPRYIIGADGHRSRIRAWAGLDRASISARRIGLRQHFTLNPLTDVQSDLVEVYWSNSGQAYVTPISPTEICVAFVAHKKFPSVQHALNQFPQLQQSLQSATPSNTPRGAVTFSRKLHRVTRGNVALIGDASGSVDAVTGEGLGLCFRQAIALGEALCTGDLAHYQREHTRLRRMPHFMAQTMLLLDQSSQLRTRALKALERRPQIFQQLLRVHIGHAPVTLFGSTGLLAAGVRILAG